MYIMKEEITRAYTRHLVNGVGVNSSDFGTVKASYDREKHRMLRMFVPKPATEEVMERYHITEDEYQEVCMDLKMRFSDWDRLREGNNYVCGSC